MRTIAILAALLLLVLPCRAQNDKPVREYYTKLYNAGELDQLADSYVCFWDGNLSFSTFAEGNVTRDHLKKTGKFNALPQTEQDLLKNGLLIERRYFRNPKGEWHSERQSMAKDGTAWVSDWHQTDNDSKVRTGIHFDLKTSSCSFLIEDVDISLRPPPQNGIETLPRSTETSGNFGRLERIPARIPQHGPEN